MRALVMVKHGTPDQALEVRQWPDPSPGPGQVRIAVKAAGLNFADLLARVGLYPDAPKPPCVMGYEVAGEIDQVGDGVAEFSVGQRVMAGTRFNGFAELAVGDLANVLPLPESFSFEQGAALPVVYGTAYAAVNLMAAVRPGETVLIHAAAGGVGIAATQLLGPRGVHIIGTASASKHDFIKQQGVEHAIDYHSQDVAREVERLTGDRGGVDVVLDALGDFRTSYKMLRPGGRMVMYGVSNMMGGDKRNVAKALKGLVTMPWFNPVKLMNANKAAMGLNMLHWWDKRGDLDALIGPLMALVDEGVVNPVVAESFSFDRAGEAHRYVQERKNVGKVVLTP